MSMWVDNIARSKSPLRFMRAISRPYMPVAVFASICSMGGALLETGGSYIFKKIVDTITLEGTAAANEVWMWAIIYMAFFLFLPLFLWRLSGFFGMRWAVGVKATSTFALSSYVTRHSSDYFHKRFAGAIGGKIGNTSNAVRALVEKFLWSQLILVVTLITSFVLAFQANILVGWLFVLWLAVVGPINFWLARKRVAVSAASQREDTRVRAQVIDLLTNIGAMHDFARRLLELSTLKALVNERYKISIKSWTLAEIARIVSNVLQLVFVGSILFVAIFGWTAGFTTAGDIVLVLALVVGLGFRMEELGRDINAFAENYGEIREGLEDLLNPYDVEDTADAKPLELSGGGIEFKDVTFIYGEGGRVVLSNFNLSIPAGQKVGLVGRSGAGKSTLIKLLLRHYDVTGGEVLIDGQNIALATQESVRQAIALVPQEPLLFHRTIKENIAYGKLDAKQDEVVAAAVLARADDFIAALPEGYGTMVGERGVKLSGGERQRIALARALLKPSKILALDEATSALDSESEAAIKKALRTLMKGKTVLAIAHRLSTLKEMDRIVVLSDGQIAEDGTHEELLEKKGLYAELWTHQSGGYLKDEE